MTDSSIIASGWRRGAAPQFISEIEAAFDQLAADLTYEKSGKTIGETLEQLQVLSQVSLLLAGHMFDLSPVGMAALHQASRIRTGMLSFKLHELPRVKPIFRQDVENAVRLLLSFSEAAELAPSVIHSHNMSEPKDGAGTGSNFGKESDLRVIGYADDFKTVPYRNPKDKFGVRVIEALYRDPDHRDRPLTQRDLAAFLDQLWIECGKTERVNWDRVVKSRSRIAKKVRLEERRRSARAARNQ